MTRKGFATLVFITQVALSIVSGYTQGYAVLTADSPKPLSPSWLITWEAFLLLGVILVWKQAVAINKKVTIFWKPLMVYIGWFAAITFNICALQVAVGLSNSWRPGDSVVIAAVIVGSIIVLAVAKFKRMKITDPAVKGWLGVFFRFIPQIVLAYSIYTTGLSSLIWPFIVIGHYTILTRIWQIVNEQLVQVERMTFGELSVVVDRIRTLWSDADFKNAKANIIAELGNEVSWVIVSSVWYFCT